MCFRFVSCSFSQCLFPKSFTMEQLMNFTADFLSKSMANTLEAEEYYEVSGRAWKGVKGQ